MLLFGLQTKTLKRFFVKTLQINQAVFVEATPATLQMLRLVSHYVAHGTPTLKVPFQPPIALTLKFQPHILSWNHTNSRQCRCSALTPKPGRERITGPHTSLHTTNPTH